MLYKKIHRRHVRKWRIGREFKIRGEVYEVTEKPDIKRSRYNIWVGEWKVISLISGQLWHEDDIKWLE